MPGFDPPYAYIEGKKINYWTFQKFNNEMPPDFKNSIIEQQKTTKNQVFEIQKFKKKSL